MASHANLDNRPLKGTHENTTPDTPVRGMSKADEPSNTHIDLSYDVDSDAMSDEVDDEELDEDSEEYKSALREGKF
jgi:hypothetical protein